MTSTITYQKRAMSIKTSWKEYINDVCNDLFSLEGKYLSDRLKWITDQILQLVNIKILSNSYIEFLSQDIEGVTLEIIDWCEHRQEKRLLKIIMGTVYEMIDNLILECQDYDLFEACSNLKKFEEIYCYE